MRNPVFFDSVYLPIVRPIRARTRAKIDTLVRELDNREELLGWLLAAFSLRFGHLKGIPDWLRMSSEALARSVHHTISQELCRLAAVEEQHTRLLLDDLVEVYRQFRGPKLRELLRVEDLHRLGSRKTVAELAASHRPFEVQLIKHLQLRQLTPTTQLPLLTVAIDLELAIFDGRLCRPIVEACDTQLGSIDACRYFCARLEQAGARRDRDEGMLRRVIVGPQQAESWAKISSALMSSYVKVLEACVDEGRRLAPHARAQVRTARHMHAPWPLNNRMASLSPSSLEFAAEEPSRPGQSPETTSDYSPLSIG